jgi:hypothetical protein
MQKVLFCFSFISCLFFVSDHHFAYGQTLNGHKVDTSNYYQFLSNGQNILGSSITTDWLREDDVVPIIIDEMNKAKCYANSYVLYKVDKESIILLHTYCSQYNFGFLYIDGHSAQHEKEHRQNLTMKDITVSGAEYQVEGYDSSGKSFLNEIYSLPKNIFVLNENCYWFQYTNNPKDASKLISKKIAIEILKQDIRNYISRITK